MPDQQPLITPEQADGLWRQRLEQGLRVSFLVGSGSMCPSLMPGDQVTVERYRPGSGPRLGEIVLLRMGGQWVVHRLIGRKGKGSQARYRQRGDASGQATWIGPDAISGRVVMVRRADGSMLDQLQLRQRIVNALRGRFYGAADLAGRAGLSFSRLGGR